MYVRCESLLIHFYLIFTIPGEGSRGDTEAAIIHQQQVGGRHASHRSCWARVEADVHPLESLVSVRPEGGGKLTDATTTITTITTTTTTPTTATATAATMAGASYTLRPWLKLYRIAELVEMARCAWEEFVGLRIEVDLDPVPEL